MKKILFILLIWPLFNSAQNVPFESGARNLGMGNTTLAISQVWSVCNNQAGMGYLENPEIGVYYTNRFLLKELSSQSLAFVYPTKFGTVGASIDYFGYTQHSEIQMGIAYAKKFNKFIALGAKFNYLQYQQPEAYGNTHAVVAELGLLSHPYNTIFIGVHVYNPSMSKFNTAFEKSAPSIFNFGISYIPDPLVSLSAQIDKNIEMLTTYKMGVELNLNDLLFIRAGINIQPNAYFIGLGYYFKNIKLDLAFSYQQMLGVSPASSLGYEFK